MSKAYIFLALAFVLAGLCELGQAFSIGQPLSSKSSSLQHTGYGGMTGELNMARHVQWKACKKKHKKRPKKSRPSDIHRKKPEYNVNPGEGMGPAYELGWIDEADEDVQADEKTETTETTEESTESS
mmetsp:Transcript_18936/g.27340  ORF Transcript_18936/g.27340 Transcript_18936/m.27340 type:complete len:127 (-) Transcript_18936:158-538(-)|eukprot:CAMPEP_0113943064 /NCGR_PEP_ID=MMETSP1339-20121228/18995_1 /TAXON_ID=94617 /ORGANISM="Fibrocapsa japonica" /LENGTH=126 /DNA_ID=CAMNT_0000947821 /DNA_START=90 /DNA_END=470 /DNA_ORIENTATION=- /assembly_acc=CAM_ASM_000762